MRFMIHYVWLINWMAVTRIVLIFLLFNQHRSVSHNQLQRSWQQLRQQTPRYFNEIRKGISFYIKGSISRIILFLVPRTQMSFLILIKYDSKKQKKRETILMQLLHRSLLYPLNRVLFALVIHVFKKARFQYFQSKKIIVIFSMFPSEFL